MKHNFFKTVLMLVLCLVFGTSAAQTIIVNNQTANSKNNALFKPSTDLSKYNKRVVTDGVEMYSKKDNNSIRSKKVEADEYVTVTFKYQYDNTKIYPMGNVGVYGDNYKYTEFYFDFDWENGGFSDCICQIPTGNYDFFAAAIPLIDGIYYGSTTSKVIEQINVNQDTTITIDFSDCNVRYDTKTYLSNGEETVLDKYIYDENYEIVTTSTGNLYTSAYQISLILKGFGVVTNNWVFAGSEMDGGYPATSMFFNELSDRYKIAGATSFVDNDGNCYVVKLENQSVSEHLLTHDASNYICYQEKFTPSLSNNMDNEGVMALSIKTLLDNVELGGLNYDEYSPLSDCTFKLYIDAAQSESNEESKYDVMVTPRFGDKDNTYVVTYSWEDEDGTIYTEEETVVDYRFINGLPIVINNNEVEYVNTGINAFRGVEGGGSAMAYPGHPQFSFFKGQKALNYGSNCPINVVRSENTEGTFFEGKYAYLDCNYIGRYGEERNVDFDAAQAEIKYNDEIICNNYGTMGDDLYNFAAQGNPDGVITAHFVNNNMMVDGLQGSNVTDIYMDQRQEDWTAPTLQMLLFKDCEGNIIDRFATADEGTLEFAGGDFDFVRDMQTWAAWYNCKEQTVEVFYSPYCADQWLPLEVNEVPSEFFMPAFGYFYRGSLQSVTNGSQTGWYDLMVKLTDASGNWQQQMISPAFRIGSGSPTGIETVNSNDATEVARYTIDGRAISAPQAGVNIVKMSDGTVKKVLVK